MRYYIYMPRTIIYVIIFSFQVVAHLTVDVALAFINMTAMQEVKRNLKLVDTCAT